MSIAETVRQKVASLPKERQREVLAFVERLEQSTESVAVDPYGLLRDRATDLPLEEFQRARREMAANAPRALSGEGD